MASTVRVKTWISGDTLTAADLNAEFNNLLTGGINNIQDANIASNAAISLSKISNTAVSLTDTQTLINKTLGSGTKVSLGSDAQGDVYYNAGAGVLTRLAPGTSGQFLQTQGAGANPQWATAAPSINYATASVSSFSTNSGSLVDVTGSSITINPTASAHVQAIITGGWQDQSGTSHDAVFALLIDGNIIQSPALRAAATGAIDTSFALCGQAIVSSGARIIKLQIRSSGGDTIAVDNVNICVIWS